MRRNGIVAAVLVVLLALPLTVYAQPTDPLSVSEAFIADLNDANQEAAAAALAEEPEVEAPQAMSWEEGTDPAAQEQHVGIEEVELWIEGYMSAGGNTGLEGCSVEGEVATCDAKFMSDRLTAMGIAEIEGELMIKVNAEGKVEAFNFVPTAESVAKLQAVSAAPPVTGSRSLFYLALVVVLLGLMAGGVLGVWLLQRHWRRAH